LPEEEWKRCLTPFVADLLREVYGYPPDEPITEELYDSTNPDGQRLFYARGYNIGYVNKPCSGYFFGNPIRDAYMTDHVGYLYGKTEKPWLRSCFPQWLTHTTESRELEERCSGMTAQEMAGLLDALAVLARFEEKCPECMMELGAIINKKDRFAHERDFKEWVRKREKRGVL